MRKLLGVVLLAFCMESETGAQTTFTDGLPAACDELARKLVVYILRTEALEGLKNANTYKEIQTIFSNPESVYPPLPVDVTGCAEASGLHPVAGEPAILSPWGLRAAYMMMDKNHEFVVAALGAEMRASAAEHETLRQKYNSLVEEHNALVSRYNQLLDTARALASLPPTFVYVPTPRFAYMPPPARPSLHCTTTTFGWRGPMPQWSTTCN